jgi:hypothetical protein
MSCGAGGVVWVAVMGAAFAPCVAWVRCGLSLDVAGPALCVR